MQKGQHGVTITGLLVVLISVAMLALLAMKVIPSFLEFRTAKTAIELIARSSQNTVEARRAFETARRSTTSRRSGPRTSRSRGMATRW